jgi:hypothetical protein
MGAESLATAFRIKGVPTAALQRDSKRASSVAIGVSQVMPAERLENGVGGAATW